MTYNTRSQTNRPTLIISLSANLSLILSLWKKQLCYLLHTGTEMVEASPYTVIYWLCVVTEMIWLHYRIMKQVEGQSGGVVFHKRQTGTMAYGSHKLYFMWLVFRKTTEVKTNWKGRVWLRKRIKKAIKNSTRKGLAVVRRKKVLLKDILQEGNHK